MPEENTVRILSPDAAKRISLEHGGHPSGMIVGAMTGLLTSPVAAYGFHKAKKNPLAGAALGGLGGFGAGYGIGRLSHILHGEELAQGDKDMTKDYIKVIKSKGYKPILVDRGEDSEPQKVYDIMLGKLPPVNRTKEKISSIVMRSFSNELEEIVKCTT